MSLDYDLITFGKYKDKTLSDVLKDRNYCSWLQKQDWFQTSYEFLYNRIKEYKPKTYFIKDYNGESKEFIYCYTYFNLIATENLKINLTESEMTCYNYYLALINDLKNKITERIETCKPNFFDIKAPVRWLKRFETDTEISREDFKIFLASYELPNIPYIVEDIKREGGIEYKGAQSFNIAKRNSLKQEKWWEELLKRRYGEDLGAQFKFEKCIFDFINISTSTIFECKLNLKDFNEEQHKKYLLTLNKYRIIYLIGNDTVINIEKSIIFTKNKGKYNLYIHNIPNMKDKSKFDELISNYTIIEVNDQELELLFGL
jgi:hypothetical protein